MPVVRVTLLIFLLVTFSACNFTRERQVKALVNDANKLIHRDTAVTEQWAHEIAIAFTTDKRSQFPANREFLKPHAAQIIRLLDESSGLNNGAADKFDQAAGLSRNDRQHRGFSSFASAFRKTVEINEILKSQMQMVSDDTIVDQQTFNDRFLHSWEIIHQKRRESDQDFQDGRRLLGW
jgi:hypothetical protein